MHVVRKVAAGEPATTDEHRELVGRYEQLRADALAGAGHGWRWGRALLERHGVAVWIDTWRELPAPARSSPATAAAVPTGSEQLVAVLAAMALAITTTTGGCT